MNETQSAESFRETLRAAVGMNSPTERLNTLARLSQPQLGFLESIQVDNALRQTANEDVPGFARVRLAVLSSCTIDHLLPAIRVAGLRRGMRFEVYKSGFGQYRQDILAPDTPLKAFAPEIILLSLTAREVLAQVPPSASAEEAERVLMQALEELRSLWRTARNSLNALVVQQTFLDVYEPLFGSYDRLAPTAPTRLVARLNERLAEFAAQDRVLLLDVSRASARDGIAVWFDIARWLQGKIEIAPRAAPIYGELLSRVISAQRGQSKKCLVLDLDNTLWGGVIGDDGLEGIVIGEGSALGEAHLALQRYAKALKERGIILAVCSKNEAAVAESAFRDHPDMVLRRSDIAAFVVNWEDKAQNLKVIAQQLNIGLDSLVFVDDNPVERARVRESLPMVSVPELASDPALYVNCIAESGYFEAVSFTSEDRDRADQYAANVQRDVLRGSSDGVQTFLSDLDMQLEFGRVTPVDLARASQLVNKTNQFNMTTRRYSTEEVARLADSPENLVLQFRLRDRFGDNGLVSVMIMRSAPDDVETMELDTWVMSCRVFGRQLEFEAMNIAVELARDRGVRAFGADYIPTEKNGVVRSLYETLGFTRQDGLSRPLGSTRWFLRLEDYLSHKTYITRRIS
ncbi:MAG: HAD-IIIC family phosphatase [Burkholderiales bacterium]